MAVEPHCVLPFRLDEAWLASQKGIDVLSLDCFDTLFWRQVAEPVDIFFELAREPIFKASGLSPALRVRAEAEARKLKWVIDGGNEVSIEEVYRCALPTAGAEEICDLVKAEIDCEIRHGFIFEPILRLLDLAKTAGLKVILVSDIYYSESQLKALLDGVFPGLSSKFDRVFCSSTFGRGKSTGIWKSVCERLRVKPDRICHIGDNLVADYHGPISAGIRALHLGRHSVAAEEVLRQRLQVALQLFPELRFNAAVPSLFHAEIAREAPESAAERIGQWTIGPILYAFARFVGDSIEALEADGRPVRVGFLLRDGHLPALACRALLGDDFGTELNISRFAAIAATIDSPERVQQILAEMLSKDGFAPLLRQMLVPEDLAKQILQQIDHSRTPERDFVRMVTRREFVRGAIERSKAYRQRLYRHIIVRTGLQPGDRLVFVDLGYSGTAQNLLAPVLKADLGVELQGVYLLAGEVKPGYAPRRGLVDPAWVDPRVIGAMTGFAIASFEMMCTRREPSTIDFTAEGEPVFADVAVERRQLETVATIQAACVSFVERLRDVAPCHRPRETPALLGRSAAVELARLLYFPRSWEIDCIKGFEFDVNLGSDLKLRLVDVERSARQMRQSGFLFMDAEMCQRRTNFAMELRHIDVSLATLLFAQNRSGFAVFPADASFRREPLQVALVRGEENAVQQVDSVSTLDGFFAANVPSVSGAHIALMFGARYSCLEIDAVQLVTSAGKVVRELESGSGLILDGLNPVAGRVFSVEAGGMMVILPVPEDDGYAFRVVFRPLAMRSLEKVEVDSA